MDNKDRRDTLMTPVELQAWLGCGKTKTWNLLWTGQIPSYRVGRLVRVRREDVEAFLERNRYSAEDR